MATIADMPIDAKKSKTSHEERTANEFRARGIHQVTLSSVKQINPRIRLIQLSITDRKRGIDFLAGQWLDTFIPGLPKAGGFTITSTPSQALPYSQQAPFQHQDTRPSPFLELAIQKSPNNPPAAYLWRPMNEIIGTQLLVRVGGGFVWPPTTVDHSNVKTLVLIAGGVGINPLISIISHLHETQSMPQRVHFLYSTKVEPCASADETLFLPRLMNISKAAPGIVKLQLFASGLTRSAIGDGFPDDMHTKRMSVDDVSQILPTKVERESALCYVCGPQQMTDHFVDGLRKLDGLDEKNVLCEKWW